jgi:arylformamidase
MELVLRVGGVQYAAHTSSYTSLSIDIAPSEAAGGPECFGLPRAQSAPFTAGTFVASVDAGASINCPVISSLCPHSNGTHTECVGHALPGRVTLRDIAPVPPLLPAVLLSVAPGTLGAWRSAREGTGHAGPENDDDVYSPGSDGDLVVTAQDLEAAVGRVRRSAGHERGGGGGEDDGDGDDDDEPGRFLRGGALVIRTLPNEAERVTRVWTGSNPPYVTPGAMRWALARGVEHILLDLPSADKEVRESHRGRGGVTGMCLVVGGAALPA